MDFSIPADIQALLDECDAFIDDVIVPIEAEDDNIRFFDHRREDARTDWDRDGLPNAEWEALLGRMRREADAAGLLRYQLPARFGGRDGSNLAMAIVREHLARRGLGLHNDLQNESSIIGNFPTVLMMEKYGSEAQQQEWIPKMLAGEARIGFGLTEPLHGSDATWMETTAVRDGDEWVINGEKYYISGAGDPRCKIMIVMCQTSPDGPPHRKQSQILVPIDTPGVKILGPMHVFGQDDAPHGHMHIRFDDVRVPASNMLLGEGRGFEISQLRLGPGRIHHCMRSIGAAEKALDLMVRRGATREGFGKPLVRLGGNMEIVARARTEIEAMRMMVLRAAKAMDTLGNAEARVWISAVKAMVPERVCQIIDQAIQMHGATGVSQWTPLASMYAGQRTLRLADGPDEVHWMVVGRAEVAAYDGLEVPLEQTPYADPELTAAWAEDKDNSFMFSGPA